MAASVSSSRRSDSRARRGRGRGTPLAEARGRVLGRVLAELRPSARLERLLDQALARISDEGAVVEPPLASARAETRARRDETRGSGDAPPDARRADARRANATAGEPRVAMRANVERVSAREGKRGAESHVVVRRARRRRTRRTPAAVSNRVTPGGVRTPHTGVLDSVPAPRNVRRSRAHVRAHPSPRCHPRRSGRFRCPLPPPPPPGRRGDTSCSCTAPSSAASTTTGS